MPSTLAKRWAAAKKTFEEMTTKKRPKDQTANKAGTNSTGMKAALEAFDKAYDATEKAADPPTQGNNQQQQKALDGAEGMLKALKERETAAGKVMTNYLNMLSAAIKAEKALDKEAKSIWERGLIYLKKELQSYETTMNQLVVNLERELDKNQKALSEVEKKITAWRQKMLNGIKKGLAVGAKFKGLAAAAGTDSQKLLKAIEAFNKEAVGQVAEEIDGLLDGAKKAHEPRQCVIDAPKKQLHGWVNGGNKVPRTTPPMGNLVDAAKEFTTAMKEIEKWYAGFIKTN